MNKIDTLAIIPARYASTRLTAKPLLKLAGKELVLRVWAGVCQSRQVDRIIVATDHEEIMRVVEKAGGEAVMTPSHLPTGNDRVAYVAQKIPSHFVLNVQGDDPMVSTGHIDPLISALKADPERKLSVLAKKIDNPDEINRSSIVKIVFDQNGQALYFSRSAIPFSSNADAVYYKHIGPYAWQRQALFKFTSWPRTPLEKVENLEMLRLLENGANIKCLITEIDTIEIDTPQDVEEFEKLLG